MENIKMDLFEQYIKQASKYLVEDEKDLDVDDADVETDEEVDTDVEDETEEGAKEGDEEEALELDLANPVCPACGAKLAPTADEVDTDEIDDDEEANAIEYLEGLGYIVYKPDEIADDEDFGEEGFDSDKEDFDFDDTEDDDDKKAEE